MENKTEEAKPESSAPEQHAPSNSGWYKATFPRRLAASLIDGVILVLIQLGVTFLLPENLRPFTFIISMVYSTVFIWQKGATPGKMAVGIKVVRTNGENLNLLQAFLREVVGKFLSALVFSLGYLWMLWDKNNQTWHDKIAGSYVVTKIPNNGKKSGCLIALLICLVIAPIIIAIIAAVVVMAINPLELTRRSRDAFRITQAVNLQSAINVAVQNANDTQDESFTLCTGSPVGMPCEGRSDKDYNNSDGTGWVKINLKDTPTPLAMLEPDPVNNDEFHFTYCSDGTNWEINFKLESEQQKAKMMEDTGDNANLYELGSNLTTCK